MAEMASLRNAYGETLVELGKENKNIVDLEADLGGSTMGVLFEKAYPDRFYEMGIAEADMASTAAGLAFTGKVPFFGSFAVFVPGRCYDQIRTGICIAGLNVKICGSSAGLSDYGDGATHQSIDDIGLMRGLPNMEVFIPVDANQTKAIVKYMANNNGPMYIRINRNPLPVLTAEDEEFVPGKLYVMKEGTDVTIFAYGVMVSKALEAAEILEQKGISVRVVNVPSIKPIDEDQVAALANECNLTIDEHSIYGGLGDVICAILAAKKPCKVKKYGINDEFGCSAMNYPELLVEYGFTPEKIAAAVEEARA
ncbi:MAG: transketolase family protein [Lachnospiraceae bacterium]|nr:transketolase family protein [Lachnospiraceae bacterium]